MVTLTLRGSGPIYEQIRDELRRMITTGVIPDGEKLPSVRELASGLAINPNTIQRAYRELEGEGCIISLPGKGSFAKMSENAVGRRREELIKKLDELSEELMSLGVTRQQLSQHILSAKGEDKK